MSWECKKNVLTEHEGFKVEFAEDGYTISFDEALGLLENDQTFRKFFIDSLSSMDFAAFNLEFPPINIETINRPFEFVVLNAPALLAQKAQANAFAEHFTDDELNAIFENLAGDAVLIAPKPLHENADYGHLWAFLQNAPFEQIDDFFVALAEIASANVGKDNLWLNTSGFGVPWLHFRLDDEPKYYQFEAYKK